MNKEEIETVKEEVEKGIDILRGELHSDDFQEFIESSVGLG